MAKCSLCKQEFDDNDRFIKERKEAHEKKHARGHSNNSRSKGGGNNIIGEVKWT